MRGYFSALIAVFLLFAVTIWLPALLLWRTGEIWPERFAVRYLLDHDAIWSSGLIQNEKAFKRAMYDTIRPDVIAVGSSMVLQFRQQMFNAPFLNMGRGLDEALDFRGDLSDLTAEHRPKLILWGIDYWVLADSFRKSGMRNAAKAELVRLNTLRGRVAPEVLPTDIFSTWDLIRAGKIREGKISIADAATAILHGASLPGPRLGLRAAITDYGGYIRDGSFYYFDIYERPASRYESMLRRSHEHGSQNSVYGLADTEQISDEALAEVAATLRMLRSRGVSVALFIPPFPPPMAAAITRKRPDLMAFIGAANERLGAIAKENGAVFYDYLADAAAADIQFDEFLDAGHPGEPASAKMLRHLGSMSNAVVQFTDREAVDSIIEKFGGLALVDRPAFYARFGVFRKEPWPTTQTRRQ